MVVTRRHHGGFQGGRRLKRGVALDEKGWRDADVWRFAMGIVILHEAMGGCSQSLLLLSIPFGFPLQRVAQVLPECGLRRVRRSMLTIRIRIRRITRSWVGRRERDPVVDEQGVHKPLAGREYGQAGRWDAAPRRSVWDERRLGLRLALHSNGRGRWRSECRRSVCRRRYTLLAGGRIAGKLKGF
ncbi:hypothetical protein FIBSPDRAFT_60095 [Athelia psychrophila]|uniref:Uncharacterized protein n=1 Tax=Athelia psychrophila TaxID=1759441 RepID=A0A166F4R5_9AGAM|nr:hypothetical protein FIBSPDRAFT_60095 [Fibularhizoctonia sp. CBS 109695]